MNDADYCRRRKWEVGTRVAATYPNGDRVVLTITAIGEQAVLCVHESTNGVEVPRSEACWTFSHRTWRRLPRSKR